MSVDVLVAGVGNIFLGDDGFGPAVIARLEDQGLPDGVEVRDYGIGGVHLAYDLADGVGALVLVDALPRDADPGTVFVLEVDDDASLAAGLDAHAMDPGAVFASLRALGGTPPPTYVVGCVPADVTERMELSPSVQAAVAPAAGAVRDLVRTLVHGGNPAVVSRQPAEQEV